MATNFWPTPQDYNEAVQNPHACFADPDLKDGIIATNMLGLPRSMTGAFASVYKITTADKAWAVRCFLTSRLDQKDRYKHISDFVLFDSLDFTIDFHYVEKGINVKGQWYPCLKMPWVEGETLDQWLAKNYKDAIAMKNLLAEFHKLVDGMECAGIGHGDLQHGNVIVTKDGLRLVDYDALFVPALLGRKSLELGHPNYQHPERNEHHYDPDVDNFSCWLISLSLIILAIDPKLYDDHFGGDDCLLFKRTDLQNPADSKLFKTLKQHDSERIRESAHLLERMLWAAPTAIPILDCPPEHLDLLPQFKMEHAPLISGAGAGMNCRVAEHGDAGSQGRLEDNGEDSAASTDENAWYANQQNRFDFIDDEAVLVQQSKKKKSKKSAVQQISLLNQRRRKVLEDLHLFFSPHGWVSQHMAVALHQFDSGQYESALNTYMRIYKLLEKNNWSNSDSFFFCLMGLGYCSALSDKVALAGNYFLLAIRSADTETRALRAALCLATIRFAGGDHAGAHKLVKEHWKGPVDLGYTVESELKNLFLVRASTFEMLASLGVAMQKANEHRWSDPLTCAKLVLDRLNRAGAQAMTEEYAEAVLVLANQYLKSSDFGRAQTLYQQVGRSAIASGSAKFGSKALFCACCLYTNALVGISALKQERQAVHGVDLSASQEDQVKNLNLVADFIETDSDVGQLLLSEMVEQTRHYVPRNFIYEVLLDLTSLLLDRKQIPPASACLETAADLIINFDIPLEERLFTELSRFEDTAKWHALSSTFFSSKKPTVKPLTDFLLANQRTDLLTFVGQRLAETKQTSFLSIVFERVALLETRQFGQWCKEFAPTSFREQDTVVQALNETADRFIQSLRGYVTKYGLQAAGPEPGDRETHSQVVKEYLNSINAIREFLHQYEYVIDADWIAGAMMHEDVAPYLIEWMRELEMQSLSSLLEIFVAHSDTDVLTGFVRSLVNSPGVDNLETIMRNLRTWGIAIETLEQLLMPASELCLNNVLTALDKATMKNGKLKVAREQETFKDLRVLLRLRSVTTEAGLERKFAVIMRSLFSPDRIAKLSHLMLDSKLQKHSDLLVLIAINIADFDPLTMESVLLQLSSELPEEALIPICKTLLLHGKAPAVVSLAKNLSLLPTKKDFFKSLSVQIVRELPEEDLFHFADAVTSGTSEEAASILLKHLQVFAKQTVLDRLLAKTGGYPFRDGDLLPVEDVVREIVKLDDPAAAADIVHLAAMSTDKKLAKLLQEFDNAGIRNDTRKAMLKKVVDQFAKSLETYKIEANNKGVLKAKIDILASMNIAALYRLVPFFNCPSQENDAVYLLNDDRFSDFAIQWLINQSSKNQMNTIAMFCRHAAAINNERLLGRICVQFAKEETLRPVIAIAKDLSVTGFRTTLINVAGELLARDLDDAFGAVSLELVTSQIGDQQSILDLLGMAQKHDRNALRVVLRQISFYRGPKDLKAICLLWSKTVGSDVMTDESRALGLFK
jgi:hypothetical protein